MGDFRVVVEAVGGHGCDGASEMVSTSPSDVRCLGARTASPESLFGVSSVPARGISRWRGSNTGQQICLATAKRARSLTTC